MDELERQRRLAFPTDAQIAFRAKRTGSLKTARAAVKAVLKEGDEFVFPVMEGEPQEFHGKTMRIQTYYDVMVIVGIPTDDGFKGQNFGYKRVLTWLVAAGLVKP